MHHASTSIRSLAVLLACLLTATADVSLQDDGAGSNRCLTIANELVSIRINPAVGGRIESFVFLPTSSELTRPLAVGKPGGLLSDHVWQQDYFAGDWLRQEYAVEILENSPERVSIRLIGEGRLWQGLRVAKTLTLTRRSPALKASYTWSATDAIHDRAMPDLWFHQALRGPGTAYLNSEAGVLAIADGQNDQVTVTDPPRGWAAYRADRGDGLAAMFDMRRVKALRHERRPTPTLEWIWRKLRLEPGEEVTTDITLAPFQGLSRVDGVNDHLVGGLQIQGESIVVQLAGLEAVAADIVLSWYHLGTGQQQDFARTATPLAVSAGGHISFRAALPAPPQGHLVVVALVRTDGQELLLERPLQPTGDGIYAMLPEAQRIPEKADVPTWQRHQPKDLSFSSLDYPTPHLQWAPSWAGGRPRVLALVPLHEERQAIELAQRFDMDLTCVGLTDSTYYVVGDRVRSLKLHEFEDNLRSKLAQEYDVIITSAFSAWKLLPDWAREEILAKTRAGTGLIVHQRGQEPPELTEAFPLSFHGYDRTWGPLSEAEGAPPIVAALPYAALPEIRASNGMRLRPDWTSTDSPVLLNAYRTPTNGGPLVAVGKLGKGRVVQMCIGIPFGPNQGKLLFRSYDKHVFPAFDYWEYHYALMARLAYWAAHKESPISLTAIRGLAAPSVEISLSSKKPQTVELQLLVWNWFGEVVDSRTESVTLPQGASTHTIAIDELAGNRAIVDVRITADASTLAFGAGTFPTPETRIFSVALDEPHVARDNTTRVRIVTEGPLPEGAVIRGEIVDGSGRIVATNTVAADRHCSLDLTVARVHGQWYRVRLSLLDGSRVLHQAHTEGIIQARRESGVYRAFFWSGVGPNSPEHITLHDYSLQRQWGINSAWLGTAHLSTDARTLRMLDMPFSVPGVGMAANRGVSYTDAQAKPDAAGQFHTQSFEKIRESARAKALHSKHNFILQYSLGDENRGAPEDTDFGRDALLAFRQWLQSERYQDLLMLNRAWQTDYTSFDAVMPMTEEQGKEHLKAKGSCAPWLDHRLFMNHIYALRAKQVVSGILAEDPLAAIGPSGTQEASVYGCRDWWLLARAYTGLAAYGGLQEAEQTSSNPAFKRLFWSGYSKPDPFTRHAVFAGMLKGNQGVGIFSKNSHTNPDHTLSEAGKAVKSTLLTLKTGIGQLLVSAEPNRAPVYLLQSPSSLYASHMLGDGADARTARAAVQPLCESLGVGYQNLSYEQLAKGFLASDKARVLLAVHASALSPKECIAISRFVESGGTLIVEGPLATLDGHGRHYPESPLAALTASPRFIRLPDGFLGEISQSLGTATDDASEAVLRKNLSSFDRYLAAARVAVSPRLDIHDQNQARVLWTKLFQKQLDEISLIGVLRTYSVISAETEDVRANLNLPQGGAVYDVIHGRYLGTGRVIPLTVTNNTNRLFAVLKSPVASLTVTAPETARPGEDIPITASLALVDGTPGRHVFRVEVFLPDGTASEVYSTTFVGQGAEALTIIPLARNDPPGTWRLTITDVATGTRTEHTIEVAP